MIRKSGGNMNKFIIALLTITLLSSSVLAQSVEVELKDVTLYDTITLISKADNNSYVIDESAKDVKISSLKLKGEPKSLIIQLSTKYNYYITKDSKGINYVKPRKTQYITNYQLKPVNNKIFSAVRPKYIYSGGIAGLFSNGIISETEQFVIPESNTIRNENNITGF